MNNNKASDPFDLKVEHFKAAPESIVDYLTNLINELMSSDELPRSLSTSILVPLVKSYRKPLSDGNNYHGKKTKKIHPKLYRDFSIFTK